MLDPGGAGGLEPVVVDAQELRDLAKAARGARADVDHVLSRVAGSMGQLDRRGWNAGAADAAWWRTRSGLQNLESDLDRHAAILDARADLVDQFEKRQPGGVPPLGGDPFLWALLAGALTDQTIAEPTQPVQNPPWLSTTPTLDLPVPGILPGIGIELPGSPVVLPGSPIVLPSSPIVQTGPSVAASSTGTGAIKGGTADGSGFLLALLAAAAALAAAQSAANAANNAANDLANRVASALQVLFAKKQEAQLSPEEQQALDNKKAGKPYDQAAYNRAQQKLKQAEKYRGDRNKQKRKSQ